MIHLRRLAPLKMCSLKVVLMLEQVWHAVFKVQCAMRCHFARSLFRRRCAELQQELSAFEWVDSPAPAICRVEDNWGIATSKQIISLQAAARGHFGRRLFRSRCSEVTQELLDVDTCNMSSESAAPDTETHIFVDAQSAGDEYNSTPASKKDDFIEAMLRLYQTRVRPYLRIQ